MEKILNSFLKNVFVFQKKFIVIPEKQISFLVILKTNVRFIL